MNSGERNRIIVHPSHIEKIPWRSAGLIPIDSTDGIMEYAEEMAETLTNAPYRHLIEGVRPIMTENDELQRGGVSVSYYLPGLTTVINEVIAETLGMDTYGLQYQDYPNIHKQRTAEQIKSLPLWRPY